MQQSNKIVYIVTAGTYSDYGILDYGIIAVFSTRELADAYVLSYNKQIDTNLRGNGYPNNGQDNASIEQWEMDIRE